MKWPFRTQEDYYHASTTGGAEKERKKRRLFGLYKSRYLTLMSLSPKKTKPKKHQYLKLPPLLSKSPSQDQKTTSKSVGSFLTYFKVRSVVSSTSRVQVVRYLRIFKNQPLCLGYSYEYSK